MIRITYSRAVALMVLVTLLWSMAGIVSRWITDAPPFEMTFWRSASNALSLLLLLAWQRGPRFVMGLRVRDGLMWVSALCWSVMFTAFMVAITLTTVANVLVIMALGPLLTALLTWLWLGHHLAPVTWGAIIAAGLGIAGMFVSEAGGDGPLTGSLIAFAVPLAAALNWTVLQRAHEHRRELGAADRPDMLVAVLIGALISAALMLPLAWPLRGTASDIAWLSFLGAFQLAVPCLLIVSVTRVLPGPQVALLGTLEVLFGVAWAWLGAGETPAPATLVGGGVVLLALISNEILARPVPPTPPPIS